MEVAHILTIIFENLTNIGKHLTNIGTHLTNIDKHLRYWVEALPASVGVGQWCTAPFQRPPLPSRPPPRRPPTPP